MVCSKTIRPGAVGYVPDYRFISHQNRWDFQVFGDLEATLNAFWLEASDTI